MIRRFWFGLFVVLAIIGVTIDFSTPYFSKLFVERIQSGNLDNFVGLLLIYLGVLTTGNLLSNLRRFSGDKSAIDGALQLKIDVLKHIHDLDFAYHTNKSTGSLISIFRRGDNAFWDLYDRIYDRILTVIVGFFILIWYFSSVDIRIIGVFIGSSIITVVISRLLLPMNLERRKIMNDKEDEISGIIADNLINYETVKLFAKETWELKRLKTYISDLKTLIWRFIVTFRYIDTSLGSLINISIFLVFLLAFNLLTKSVIKISDFVLIVSAVSMFFPQLFNLVYSIRNLSQGYVDIKKYVDVLDNEIEVKDPEVGVIKNHVKGEIKFDRVYFSYETKKQKSALRNINLDIKPGESVALVGRSGAGKTTLVKLLMRFYDIGKGSISIDGIDIRNFKKSDLRGLMGVVPQEPILFNNTIGYNISYGKDNASKSDIIAAAKIAMIHDFVEGLPQKYNTKVGERGIKLSGGQKQRVAIARMILSNPDIIIFDEATSQLDSESERLIQEAFWKASEGKTTIVIAHRLSTIMRVDKIIVMDQGKIVETGTHRALLNNKESLYKKFWDLQIKID